MSINRPQYFEGNYPLHSQAIKGRVDEVFYLLSYGAELDVKDYNGNTLLHYAVKVKYLFQYN
jgi:ankyrin repeat protein